MNQEGGTSTWQPTRLIEPGEAEVKTLQDASLVPGSHHVNIYNIENISELGNNRKGGSSIGSSSSDKRRYSVVNQSPGTS